MKKSISMKWSIILGGMIVVLLVIGLLINNIFFYDYYLKHEKNDMLSFSQRLDKAYEDPEEVERLISEMTTKKQMTIAVVTDSDKVSFDYDLLQSHLVRGRKMGSMIQMDYPKDAVKQMKNQGYFFLNISESQLKLPLLALVYQLGSGEVLLLSTPLEVINRTANIAIEFNIIIAGFLIVLGMVIVFFMAKSMTRPIVSLSEMTKKMSELDFSEHFQGQGDDEINDLGQHINRMSSILESTLVSLKASNNQLILDLEEKEKMGQMRKAFIANISHELKTPIALIMSYTEGLKDNVHLKDEDKNQYLEVIEKEASHMDKLVKDLLELNALEYDATSLNMNPLDFSSLVDEVLDRYHLWIRDKALTVRIHKEDILMIQGDKHRLEKGVMNLIINGIDHCPKGGGLDLSAYVDEGNLRFLIFNSGSRLPDQEDVFHRFYSGKVKEKRTLGGSGIGLSILAAVIEKHKGLYGAHNHEDGVEFWFEIPIK